MPPALERQSLNHWTAREVPDAVVFKAEFLPHFAVKAFQLIG